MGDPLSSEFEEVQLDFPVPLDFKKPFNHHPALSPSLLYFHLPRDSSRTVSEILATSYARTPLRYYVLPEHQTTQLPRPPSPTNPTSPQTMGLKSLLRSSISGPSAKSSTSTTSDSSTTRSTSLPQPSLSPESTSTHDTSCEALTLAEQREAASFAKMTEKEKKKWLEYKAGQGKWSTKGASVFCGDWGGTMSGCG